MLTKFYDYNQEQLVKHGVTMQEAYVLHYLDQFFKSGNAERDVFYGKEYYKIFYSKILNDNPLLDIKEDRLRKILRHLESLELLERCKRDTNSTILFVRVTDHKLRYTLTKRIYQGKDTMLAHFINTTWQIRKNGKCHIELYEDKFGEHMRYSSTFMSTAVIMCNIDYFKRQLYSNLRMCLTPAMFNLINNDITIVDGCIELSTIQLGLSTENGVTLTNIFDQNKYQIENAICMAFIETFKIL